MTSPAFGNLWALDVGTGIIRLSESGEILETLPGISGGYLALDGTTAWVSDVGHAVDRVDLKTGEVVATIDVPAGPKEMVVFEGSVWVACDGGGVVARIDIATNTLVAEIPAGTGRSTCGRRGRRLGLETRPEVWRIDPTTNEVVAKILSPAQPLIAPTVFVAGLAVGGPSVWVGSSDGINRVDPAVNEIVEICLSARMTSSTSHGSTASFGRRASTATSSIELTRFLSRGCGPTTARF